MTLSRRVGAALALAAPLFLAAPAAAQDKTNFMGRDPGVDELIEALKPGPLGTTRGIRLNTAADTPESTGGGEEAGLKTAVLDVKFAFDSAALTPAATELLRRLGQALSSEDLRAYRFRMEGHTDSLGTEAYNLALSQRRAAAVQDFLEKRYGLPRESLEIRGMGEAKPLDPSDPESGVNRRVEIINLGSGSSAP